MFLPSVLGTRENPRLSAGLPSDGADAAGCDRPSGGRALSPAPGSKIPPPSETGYTPPIPSSLPCGTPSDPAARRFKNTPPPGWGRGRRPV
ncbi:hypothetical protein SKAU_G00148500 [Synaphobranchus kaupii]|uniref:Uncharacterized protein n=1 Tax=Synaphobranchus kaupii TaxID=118154 RepID=A0A9Q1J3Z7_SYNKA|nr:hypothetical protein SKAU_G00148500 [Synaphobranchus kaupii]